MRPSKSTEMLDIVAEGLKELADEVVFLGGATTGLYIDDPSYPEVRPTEDVDCIVQIASRVEYAKLEQRLRKLGFQHDYIQGSPLCRWKFCGVTVDVMPTNAEILGFSNRWYPSGIAQCESFQLPSGRTIRVLSAINFLATKNEAFENRGAGDYRFSPDFEDIVSVLDGRSSMEGELLVAPLELRAYFSKKFRSFLKDSAFEEGIYSHLVPGYGGGNRVERILAILRKLET